MPLERGITMVSILRKGLIAMIAIAMTLTMFPLVAGSNAYADEPYDDGDGLLVQVNGSRLDVIVDATDWFWNKDADDDDEGDGDGEVEYTLGYFEDAYLNWADSASTVKTIFVGQGAWWIYDDCFKNFTNLETVYLPESLGGIGYDGVDDGAFVGCNSIDKVYYGGTKAEWEKLISDHTHGDNGSLLDATVVYNAGYIDISDAKVVLDKNTFTWNSSAYYFAPTVKRVELDSSTLSHDTDYIIGTTAKSNVGKGYVTCYGRNQYAGKKMRTFKVIPKKTSVKKVTSPAKKKIKVRWYKRAEKMSKSHITGYQVKIARNKKFTKEVKSFKVKGYKKTSKVIRVKKSHKRYYVKVRTYRVVNGTKYWSKWSKTKSKTSK